MKYLLLSTLFVISAYAATAQADSIYVWNKWCAKADTPLLFATANNIIYVHSKTIKASYLTVKSLDNALKMGAPEVKGDTISFMAMPYPKLGKKMRLTITDNRTHKVLRTVNFTSESAPEPIAKIGNLIGSDIPRKDLLTQNTLRVGFLNSMYSYPYMVKQYTLKTRIAGKDVVLPVQGNRFSKEVLHVLEVAPVGTFIEFTDIKATCLECSVRDLPNLKVWVR